MSDLGVEQIIAINVVGGIDPKLAPGDLCLIDDFIDFTSGRQHTFSDGSKPGVQHVDLTRPYDAKTSCNFLKKLTIRIYVSLINHFQKQINNWVIKRRLGFNYLTVFSTLIRSNLL